LVACHPGEHLIEHLYGFEDVRPLVQHHALRAFGHRRIL
jgi:hypothetical protein